MLRPRHYRLSVSVSVFGQKFRFTFGGTYGFGRMCYVTFGLLSASAESKTSAFSRPLAMTDRWSCLYTLAGHGCIRQNPSTRLHFELAVETKFRTAYRVAQKFGTIFFLYALTLPNINRFSTLFNCQNQQKIWNNTVAKDPTTPENRLISW